jgi:hypothetical protein
MEAWVQFFVNLSWWEITALTIMAFWYGSFCYLCHKRPLPELNYWSYPDYVFGILVFLLSPFMLYEDIKKYLKSKLASKDSVP